MATVKEMMMQDAAAGIETSYEMNVGDTFEGNLDDASDADWVASNWKRGQPIQSAFLAVAMMELMTPS